jgi:hypothetical protein
MWTSVSPCSKAVTRVEPETFRVSAGAQKILWLEAGYYTRPLFSST